jgi:hypothetical protein
MQTAPWIEGIIFKTRLIGSEASGELVHKLVRVAQSTQVPWRTQVMSASCNTPSTSGLTVVTPGSP